MRFIAKLRHIGNSVGVIIPRDVWRRYAVGVTIVLEDVEALNNPSERTADVQGHRGETGGEQGGTKEVQGE